jgi:hypothetical protein
MTSVSSNDESERRLAEALRARASGAGSGGAGQALGPPVEQPAGRTGTSVPVALLIALLAGAVLGVLLALVSLLAPGVLPPLG